MNSWMFSLRELQPSTVSIYFITPIDPDWTTGTFKLAPVFFQNDTITHKAYAYSGTTKYAGKLEGRKVMK